MAGFYRREQTVDSEIINRQAGELVLEWLEHAADAEGLWLEALSSPARGWVAWHKAVEVLNILTGHNIVGDEA